MNGKSDENSMEICPIIKPGPVDNDREVSDISGEGQMSYRSVCRWVATFQADQQNLKDDARSGCSPTTATTSNIRKITD